MALTEAKEEKQELPDFMTQSASPPPCGMALAFASSNQDGLSMHVAFGRRGSGAVMTAQCVNKGQVPIRRIDVKLNKNYLGVAATQTLPLTGDLLPGDTQIVDVALALSSE